MNEPVAKRCVQEVLGWESQVPSEDHWSDAENPFCADTGVSSGLLKSTQQIMPFSPLQYTYHSMIPHCCHGLIQNFNLASRPGMLVFAYLSWSHTIGLSFLARCNSGLCQRCCAICAVYTTCPHSQVIPTSFLSPFL